MSKGSSTIPMSLLKGILSFTAICIGGLVIQRLVIHNYPYLFYSTTQKRRTRDDNTIQSTDTPCQVSLSPSTSEYRPQDAINLETIIELQQQKKQIEELQMSIKLQKKEFEDSLMLQQEELQKTLKLQQQEFELIYQQQKEFVPTLRCQFQKQLSTLQETLLEQSMHVVERKLLSHECPSLVSLIQKLLVDLFPSLITDSLKSIKLGLMDYLKEENNNNMMFLIQKTLSSETMNHIQQKIMEFQDQVLKTNKVTDFLEKQITALQMSTLSFQDFDQVRQKLSQLDGLTQELFINLEKKLDQEKLLEISQQIKIDIHSSVTTMVCDKLKRFEELLAILKERQDHLRKEFKQIPVATTSSSQSTVSPNSMALIPSSTEPIPKQQRLTTTSTVSDIAHQTSLSNVSSNSSLEVNLTAKLLSIEQFSNETFERTRQVINNLIERVNYLLHLATKDGKLIVGSNFHQGMSSGNFRKGYRAGENTSSSCSSSTDEDSSHHKKKRGRKFSVRQNPSSSSGEEATSSSS
jgi:hypothetical protein